MMLSTRVARHHRRCVLSPRRTCRVVGVPTARARSRAVGHPSKGRSERPSPRRQRAFAEPQEFPADRAEAGLGLQAAGVADLALVEAGQPDRDRLALGLRFLGPRRIRRTRAWCRSGTPASPCAPGYRWRRPARSSVQHHVDAALAVIDGQRSIAGGVAGNATVSAADSGSSEPIWSPSGMVCQVAASKGVMGLLRPAAGTVLRRARCYLVADHDRDSERAVGCAPCAARSRPTPGWGPW